MTAPAPGYTPDPADVELVMRALAAEDVRWGYDHGFCGTEPARHPETAAFATAALSALAATGRLLPADARYLGRCNNEQEPDGELCTADRFVRVGDLQTKCPRCGAWDGIISRPEWRPVVEADPSWVEIVRRSFEVTP